MTYSSNEIQKKNTTTVTSTLERSQINALVQGRGTKQKRDIIEFWEFCWGSSDGGFGKLFLIRDANNFD